MIEACLTDFNSESISEAAVRFNQLPALHTNAEDLMMKVCISHHTEITKPVSKWKKKNETINFD